VSEIWTPDKTIATAEPPTKNHNIGGLDLPVLQNVPPKEVQPINHQHVALMLAILGVHVECLKREIVAIHARLDALESPAILSLS